VKRITIRVQRREGRGGWWVRIGGLELVHRTQFDAAMKAKLLAIEHLVGGGHSEVFIHGKDGSIKRRDTYPRSSDPRRSKG
jgi:hypothetical protein